MRSKNKEWLEGIVAFINSYKDEYGSSPSINQIADAVGCGKSTVDRYLKYLQEQDLVSIHGRRQLDTKRSKRLVNLKRIPICRKNFSGVEKLAEEDIEDYISLPCSVTGNGTFFFLRADDDSMIGAGIEDGDLVVVRQQPEAKPGQIIVPLINGECSTLKYYNPLKKGTVKLVPANPAYQPLVIDLKEKTFAIHGIAVKVIKVREPALEQSV